jgi:glycosyltransferase involved in cell wall biosynthesis
VGFFARSRRTTGASKPKLKRLKKKAVKICRRAFARRESPADSDAEFSHFAASVIDGPAYLAANPDVAAAGRDPLEHWFAHGIAEGRGLAPDVMIRCGAAAERLSDGGWQRFTWRGMPVAARIERISESILSQIREQTRHDPSIAAAGLKAIPNLRKVDIENLWDRDGIDIPGLFASVSRRPSVALVIPHLVPGGADKYTADVIGALRNEGHEILVIVTDQKSSAAGDWTKLQILEPLLETNIIFLPDVCSHRNPWLLARLLNGLRPQLVFVVNSRTGLDMVADFGRGLSSFARLYCAYFALGAVGLSDVRYGFFYPRRTLRFATALTDDMPTVKALHARYHGMPGAGFAMLQPCIRIAHEKTFTIRLTQRAPPASSALPRRWAWVGRVVPMKGTDVLIALAKLRPRDWFDIFGPVEGTLEDLGLDTRNIVYKGCLPSVLEADFTGHDGFVYTSLFDGMPNVVLEMSQHAIPLILADIGGLRDTFDDASAIFVEHTLDDPKRTAIAFDQALTRLEAMSSSDVDKMVLQAYRRVKSRHAPEAFASTLREILSCPA